MHNRIPVQPLLLLARALETVVSTPRAGGMLRWKCAWGRYNGLPSRRRDSMPETAATASPDPVALRDWAARGLRIAELDGHSRGSAQALVQRAEGDLLHAWATVAPEQARVVFFYALMHRLVRAGLDAATPGMTRAPEPPETAAPADTAASPARAFAQRAAASRVARHLLDAALRALPASHRHAVLLRIWIDLDVIQVGQVMGLPSAEVKLALVGGLRGLRAGLGMAAPDGEPPADDGAWILRARDVLEDSVRGTEAVTDATSVTAAGHGDAADVRVADAQVAAAVMPAAMETTIGCCDCASVDRPSHTGRMTCGFTASNHKRASVAASAAVANTRTP